MREDLTVARLIAEEVEDMEMTKFQIRSDTRATAEERNRRLIRVQGGIDALKRLGIRIDEEAEQ